MYICNECGEMIDHATSYVFLSVNKQYYHELCYLKMMKQEDEAERELKWEIAKVSNKMANEIKGYIVSEMDKQPHVASVIAAAIMNKMKTYQSFMMWVPIEILQKFNAV